MSDLQETTQLQLIQAKGEADFLMTSVGQAQRQFETMQRMAKMYTTSTIVPAAYRSTYNEKGECVTNNIGNCIIALDMATRMNCNPLMVMQNLYVVHGNPAFSSKFLIATINASRRFTPLRYEFRGTEGQDDYSCRCVAYESSDRERQSPLEGDWISIGMAKKEGWYGKSGSKWQTIPSQMLRYRAAAFWQRVYCPEISMGLITAEEAEDIQELTYDESSNSYMDPKKKTRRDAMRAAMESSETESIEETVAIEVDKETGELFK